MPEAVINPVEYKKQLQMLNTLKNRVSELEAQLEALQSSNASIEDMHDGERFVLVMECLESMSYTDLKLITDKCIELERKHAQQLRDSN